MIKYPRISVLTITYGHELYIKQTLDGILMQNYSGEVEFVIANDNSPDATDDIIQKYLSDNVIPNNFTIKYTKHDVNKGMLSNFIWILGQVSAEYIALCDGDDYWTDPLKLQKQVDFLDNNQQFVACGGAMDTLRFGVLEVKQPPYSDGSFNKLEVARGMGFPTLTSVFRNVGFASFFQYGPIVGDVELFLYLSQFGWFKLMPHKFAVYRFHGKGANSGVDYYENKHNFIRAKLKFNEVFNLHPNSFYKQELRKQIKGETIVMIKNLLKGRKGFKKSVKYILFCVKQYKSL